MLPQTPIVLYKFVTPSSRGRSGGSFVPGLDNETRSFVAFRSFEYTDTWAELDMVRLVFEDRYSLLCDHPLIRPLETTLEYSFGYTGMLTPRQRMKLAWLAQNYDLQGNTTTELFFFAASVDFGSLRKNALYANTRNPGGLLSATEVAEIVAKQNGLTPVVSPCVADALSQKDEWRQQNQTDLEFLRSLTKGLRARDGSDGRYYVHVRNYELHFGPIKLDSQAEYSFEYRVAASPLRSFRPVLPADIMRGAGWIAHMAGFDPATGALMNIQTSVDTDRGRTNLGEYVVDPQRGLNRPQRGVAAPRATSHEPGFHQRRSDLEAQRDALWRGIQATEHALREQGGTPKDIEEALVADRESYNDLLEQIRNLKPEKASPMQRGNELRNSDLMRTGLMNLATGQMELFGFPLLLTGKLLTVANVSKFFGGLWWIREVRHRIDSSGFSTSADIQKNALSVGDPTVGSPPPNRVGSVEVVPIQQTDGTVRYEPRPAKGYYEAANELAETARRRRNTLELGRRNRLPAKTGDTFR